MLSHKFYSLALALTLILLLNINQPISITSPTRQWGARPLLSYFVLTASLEVPLRQGARLSPTQFERTRQVALDEAAALQQLQQRSLTFIADPNLSLEQKRQAIIRMGYNRQVERIAYLSDQALRRVLPRDAYARLIAWIERRWPQEVAAHGAASFTPNTPVLLFERFLFFKPFIARMNMPAQSPRTYKIYATRYDSKGRYTVALPDQCLKLTNGGLRTCTDKGYIVGQTYSVFISYKKSLGVNVGESGPWNIDDNFWATLTDPTPRRMFADLPLGMPEAQAAFNNGYNGGLDQYGRKVTAPFAIDLSFEVAADLGLPNKVNDWVNVSFMWTEGWGFGSSSGGGTLAAQAIAAVQTATPHPDGSIIHEVQPGQTLWAIASAYGTTVQRLRELNGLGENDVILPGQKLFVRPAGAAPTISADVALTATLAVERRTARRTEKAANKTATPEAQAAVVAKATLSPSTSSLPSEVALPTGSQSAPMAASSRIDPFLLGFSALALVGFGLFLWGLLKRKP